MNWYEIALGVVLIAVSLLIIVFTLAQEQKGQGLSAAIMGDNTAMAAGRERGVDAKLAKLTSLQCNKNRSAPAHIGGVRRAVFYGKVSGHLCPNRKGPAGRQGDVNQRSNYDTLTKKHPCCRQAPPHDAARAAEQPAGG